ncbi:hypothetical protein BC332_03395 [Capsicum chinense]|nr:hypothetical protein BC332_03395 [Capsicum chinense]
MEISSVVEKVAKELICARVELLTSPPTACLADINSKVKYVMRRGPNAPVRRCETLARDGFRWDRDGSFVGKSITIISTDDPSATDRSPFSISSKYKKEKEKVDENEVERSEESGDLNKDKQRDEESEGDEKDEEESDHNEKEVDVDKKGDGEDDEVEEDDKNDEEEENESKHDFGGDVTAVGGDRFVVGDGDEVVVVGGSGDGVLLSTPMPYFTTSKRRLSCKHNNNKDTQSTVCLKYTSIRYYSQYGAEVLSSQEDYQQHLQVSHNEEYLSNTIKGFSISAGRPWHLIDEVYIPVNCDIKFHWVLAIIILKERRIQVYDSTEKRYFESSNDVFVTTYTEYLSDGLQVPNDKFDVELLHTRYATLLKNHEIVKDQKGYVSNSEDPP